MPAYSSMRFYSPVLDAEALRLSMADERNSEFYAVIPARGGKEERELKQAALERIEDAILRGDVPGEVR
ncbi:MAG TPA: hypothetical protein VFW46_20200 [Stellaceae bacterium]|nr:hypothetical protein [Stellaceae bacterium]